jgi:hypothetical protein
MKILCCKKPNRKVVVRSMNWMEGLKDRKTFEKSGKIIENSG